MMQDSGLMAYVAADRVACELNGAPLATDGVALIADISGFTPLTEGLAQVLAPDRGAEELTRALNGVFAPLIDAAGAYGGHVIKFAGDALIVFFPRRPSGRRATLLRSAVTAAHAMQAVIKRHGRITTPAGVFTLTMKIGMAYGPVLRIRLGDPAYGYEDVIGGATLDRMAAAEHHAQAGEVLLDPELVPLSGLVITEWRDRYAVLAPLPDPPRRRRLLHLQTGTAAERLRPFVPPEVAEAALSGQMHPAELKPVVSVFVRFTGITYEDASAAHQLERYFSTVQQIAARYGGRVNRLITGDKGSVLHLIYGAPRALESCEQRAALSVLELLHAGERLPFIREQQIGMATGRVFAGPVGSPTRCEYTVMGDTINLSARLMQQAAPGQIVIDPTLAVRLGNRFVTQMLGTVKLKGKAEPVALSALTGVAMLSEQSPDTTVYGRTSELALLRQHIERLRQGYGGSVLVVGEMGMGKTHLLHALSRSPVRWIQATAAPYDRLQSGALIGQMIRLLIRLPDLADFSALVRALQPLPGIHAPDAALILASVLGVALTPAQMQQLAIIGGDGVRWQLLTICEQLMTAITTTEPLVIALDDVQWADATSLAVVQHLVSLTPRQPLLIILVSRSFDHISSFARADITHTIELQPLSSEAAYELVRAIAPTTTPDQQAVLVERGGGSPLFLVELARAAAMGAALETLPDTVQGLLLAQIDQLPSGLRQTLQQASVLGRRFDPMILARLSGHPDCERDLQELVERGFLLRSEREYQFRHGLIQESAYSALLFAHRRDRHLAVAQILVEQEQGRLAERAGVLADHYERAEAFIPAAYWYAQAADNARLIAASTDACDGYRRSLSLLERAGISDERRASVLLKLAQASMDSGDYQAAQQFYEQAFATFPATRSQRRLTVRTPFRLGVYPHGPTTLDPGLITTSGDQELVRDLFEGLVELDLDLNVIPALATRWKVDSSGRCYTFHLRPQALWSDGVPLTAHDVVFAWQRNLAPTTGSAQAHILFVIAGAEAVAQGADPASLQASALDDHTVQVTLHTPTPQLPYILTHPVCMPLPRHAIARYGATWAHPDRLVCNGPFRISRTRAGHPLALTQNPHYHGYRPGNLQRIELVYTVPDHPAFTAGQIDWLRIEDQQAVSATASTVDLIGLATYFLLFNCRHPLLSQAGARQALAHCIDPVQLVAEVWAGHQLPASGGLIPPGMPGHTPTLGRPPVSVTPTLRAQLTHTELTLAALDGFRHTPEWLCSQWKQYLGCTVHRWNDLTPDQLFAALASGDLAMALLGWEFEYPDPQPLLHGLFHSQGALNVGGWQDATYDALIEQVAQTDLPQRRQLYHTAEQLLMQATVAVPLYYHRTTGVLRAPFTLATAYRLVRGERPRLKWLVADQSARNAADVPGSSSYIPRRRAEYDLR